MRSPNGRGAEFPCWIIDRKSGQSRTAGGRHGTVIEADREGQADIKGSLLDSHEIFYARAAGEVPRGFAF